MCEVIVTKRALKDLKAIPRDMKIVLANRLKDFSTDPLR